MVEPPDKGTALLSSPAGPEGSHGRSNGRRGLRLLWPVAGSLASTATAATILYAGIDVMAVDRSQPILVPPRASVPGTLNTMTRTPAPTAMPTSRIRAPRPSTTAPAEPSAPWENEDRRDTSPRGELFRLESSVREGIDDDEIRSDIGVDLLNLIDDMQDDFRVDGDRRELRWRLQALDAKIRIRLREGAISPNRAGRLRYLVQDAYEAAATPVD
jgi:hypothetical protein